MERLTGPSRLFGANGLRTGADGRVYVAQVTGSQISALDIETGALEVVSARGCDIVAPDDLAFGPSGELYATEVMDGRVSVRGADGRTRVLRDDVPCANGITVHRGRLFVNECRRDGRLLELDPNGGAPRVILENLALPNAMEVGPDGLLYYPVMGTNDIWRVDPDGGAPERVAGDLGVPDSVKFDARGRIVSTQIMTGEVLRIDPRSGERTVLARLSPDLDNLTFVGDQLFVSHLTGRITEVLEDGRTRSTLPGGLNWPLDLTVGPDGSLYVADGMSVQVIPPGGEPRTLARRSTPGYPGYLRGMTAVAAGELIATTSFGEVVRYLPGEHRSEVLAEGLDQLYGVEVAPSGAVVTAELGTGRVLSVRPGGRVEELATGLSEPRGVAFGPDGACLVSESGTGRILSITGSGTDTLVDGLRDPHGILVRGRRLYVVDAALKAVIGFDLDTGARHVIARDLPVGSPPGVTPRPLRGMPLFSGPQGPFAGIAAGPDGSLYLSADGEGGVLVLRETA
ncbi:SMP-30/gluconolactonase/LRE family protein [Actinocorallia populi]|uniref:SMP-30/gluconolactonase/LRE family protein n=1 Tax=Actinocorallia populi TaxID=2079200 RepID=UPI0018E5A84D|nr:SMP-30/gluconolactonase/LRE family protein [Actinocorallia populi]